MTERIVAVVEAEPGIVHVTPEALHDLLILAGFRRLDRPGDGGCAEYARKDDHVSRPPHPNTMAGK